MSSVQTTTEQIYVVKEETKQTMSPTKHIDFLEERRRTFTRSSSIDKIMKFNNYICSPNYFLLPALIAWVKTPQTVLQYRIEKCRLILKALLLCFLEDFVFNNFKSCLFSMNVKAKALYHNILCSDAIPALEITRVILHHHAVSFINNLRKKLFVLSIYFTLSLIFFQLATCIFILSKVYLPAGLIFLFVCLYLISYLNVRVSLHYLKDQQEGGRKQCPKTPKNTKKTASSFKLL